MWGRKLDQVYEALMAAADRHKILTDKDVCEAAAGAAHELHESGYGHGL